MLRSFRDTYFQSFLRWPSVMQRANQIPGPFLVRQIVVPLLVISKLEIAEWLVNSCGVRGPKEAQGCDCSKCVRAAASANIVVGRQEMPRVLPKVAGGGADAVAGTP